jgi:hypothetical protein
MTQNIAAVPASKDKQYHGEYPARVEDVNDPTGQMLVRVRVYGVFADNVATDDLPWAEYKLPVGARANDGFFVPCQVNDFVWVDFPYKGDTRRPRITGSMHYCPDGKPNLPHEAWGGPDSIEHKRGEGIPAPSTPVVTKHNTFEQNGVLVELGEDGSARVTQKKSGTAIEITAGGRILLHSQVDWQVNVVGNANIVVGGNTNIETSGDMTVKTTGTTTVNSGDNVNVNCAVANVKATGGINLDGGSGSVKGIVQGDCICAITGKPHPHISFTVKGSK